MYLVVGEIFVQVWKCLAASASCSILEEPCSQGEDWSVKSDTGEPFAKMISLIWTTFSNEVDSVPRWPAFPAFRVN